MDCKGLHVIAKANLSKQVLVISSGWTTFGAALELCATLGCGGQRIHTEKADKDSYRLTDCVFNPLSMEDLVVMLVLFFFPGLPSITLMHLLYFIPRSSSGLPKGTLPEGVEIMLIYILFVSIQAISH